MAKRDTIQETQSAMTKCARVLILYSLLSIFAAGCVPLSGAGGLGRPAADAPVQIVVSAASDLIPAFEEIAQHFQEDTGIHVSFNFGSSGLLAQQIEQGAPVDVYASANEAFVDELLSIGRVLPDTVAYYGMGRITIWARADSPHEFASLEDLANPAVRRIAIANPEHAPYGVAAREALQTLGVWAAWQDRLVLGENIAATLQYAETGNVDVGIIALSLSIAAGDEGRWVLIPAELHSPLNQTLAVVADTAHETEARAFAAYVNSEKGREIMRRYGFILPGEEAE